MNCKIIIAIDGVSASGKGSAAKLLAARFNLAALETGLLYREVAAETLAAKVDFNDLEQITSIANNLVISNIDKSKLENETIAAAASIVAKIAAVRKALFKRQRDFAVNPPYGNGAILDGRDIGTVICVDADIKFFVTASLIERAKRRYKQLNSFKKTSFKSKVSFKDVYNSIKARDKSDETLNNLARNDPSYHIIDNTNLSLENTFLCMEKYVIEAINKKNC